LVSKIIITEDLHKIIWEETNKLMGKYLRDNIVMYMATYFIDLKFDLISNINESIIDES
jgi:hypothetical protein